MSKVKQQIAKETIPYLSDLVSFYKHVQARPSLHKDFDIGESDPEVVKSYDYVAKPFRHSFYCITLFLQGDITLGTGFWKTRLSKPALYFKTPCQVVSWTKSERWLKEYFIVFAESFMLSYKALADIIFELLFFSSKKQSHLSYSPTKLSYLQSEGNGVGIKSTILKMQELSESNV